MKLIPDFVSRWFNPQSTTEKRFHPSQDPPSWFVDFIAGASAAGVRVTPDTAMTFAAVYAAVTRIAETLATLPLPIYKNIKDGRERDTEHPLYEKLQLRANPEQTAAQFREMMAGHVLLRGRAFAEIVRHKGGPLDGEIKELWPLHPDRVRKIRVGKQHWFMVQLPGGGEARLHPDQILYHENFGGLSPIKLHARSIGLGIGAEEFGAKFFEQGARISGVLTHPGVLDDKAHTNILESFRKAQEGLKNANRIAILEEGLKWQQIGIAPDEAQYLATHKVKKNDVATIFKIPPHLIGDMEHATFSNIEAQGIEYAKFTILPWAKKFEQDFTVSLLLPSQRKTHFIEYVLDGLMRGDIKTRYDSYAVGRQWGWLSANEVRRFENMNSMGPQGDIYLVPVNMVNAQTVVSGEDPQDPGDEDPEDDLDDEGRQAPARRQAPHRAAARGLARRRKIQNSFARLFAEAEGRIVRREVNDLLPKLKKILGQRNVGDAEAAIETFYDDHRKFVIPRLAPVVSTLMEAIAEASSEEIGAHPVRREDLARFSSDYTSSLANRHVSSSRNQLLKILRESNAENRDPLADLEDRLEEWEEKRPDKLARRERTQAGNAAAKFAFAASGVQALRWRTVGKNCPYCDDLDGKEVSVTSFFVEKNTTVNPEGVEPFKTKINVGHAPLHAGCDCGIEPVIRA